MKARRIKQVFIAYFTCTRTEKHAALLLGGILLFIQAALFVRHHLIQPKSRHPERGERQAIAHLQNKTGGKPKDSYSNERIPFHVPSVRPFDPNKIDENGFVELGMSPRQAASLIRYRDKIGGFRSKEDVKRVRVLDSGLFALWAPFIELPDQDFRQRMTEIRKYPNSIHTPLERKATTAHRPFVIDLNDADTVLLKELPWIGSGRARAIANYRDRLGGFVAFEQLLEIRSIPDSVYNHILPFLVLNSGPYRKLEINRMPFDSLRHPYLSKQFARMIVSYRGQHGYYSSVNDLLILPLADEEILRKLAPYLTF
jgi:DNA uptake protein ComE-like DNA-binding protein